MKIKNNTPFQVVVNGETYEAEVENTSASPLVVTVNGNRYSVEVSESGAPAAAPAPRHVAAPVAATPVSAAAPAAPAAPLAEGETPVKAPMPGTIVEIQVKPGQQVKYGETLCLLEAMKMKNAIRAPRDGEVSCIHVENEQKVAFGALLVTLK